MDADTLAAVRAALARDREAEGAMTPGEWTGGAANETTRDTAAADDAGIARARNRWRLYLALAEAVVAERQAEREAEDYANACEGSFDPIALRQPINVARAATDAALAALAEPEQEPTP